jgi:alpha-L-fucosidase
MPITRRQALATLAGAVPAIHAAAATKTTLPQFTTTRESLSQYRVPEWFRDAKFGIWAHWGPQSSVEAGDWYARNMYIQGQRQYDYHVKTYGHPSKFGYKDLIPLWKGEKFDAEHLVRLYKKAGARYFMSMAVHHDNFDMWNSKHNRWNAANMGIQQDVVGAFRRATTKHGLKFGVSDHLWISYKWFAVSHMADKDGPLADVPYDGADPKFSDLYHQIDDSSLFSSKLDWDESKIPETWKQHWALRVKDLVDSYYPDLLYSDGQLPFGNYGLETLANLLNVSSQHNSGKVEAVYTSKRRQDSEAGFCVLDRERGVLDDIWPQPWQTDTCIGDWHYKRDITYKTPKTVVDLLVDIVSKNGNLMLNFPLPNSGMLDDRELKVLEGITEWMQVNTEAVHGTRPWKISGQRPLPKSTKPEDTAFNEKDRKDMTAEDFRFTTKGSTLYAFQMGWPGKQAIIPALSSDSRHATGKIERVALLGSSDQLKFTRHAAGLKIDLPEKAPSDYAVAFRISGSGLV